MISKKIRSLIHTSLFHRQQTIHHNFSKMAIGVDTSKWKPRKIKGTPAARFRNALGLGILTFGIISGCILHFSSATEKYRKAFEVLYEDPIEEVERKIMIASGLPNRSPATIKRIEKELSRIDRPDT